MTNTPTLTATSTPTLTATSTPTLTPTLTSVTFAISSQTPYDSTVNVGASVAYAQIYSATNQAYTATWQVSSNQGVGPQTIASYSGTLNVGISAWTAMAAIDATVTAYGGGYYNHGGAGYYNFTITAGGNSLSTGFIKINTQSVTQGYEDCGCGCKDANGNIVGSWEQDTYETCNDNCCCYDCNGDGITACGDPNDPNYDTSNPPCRKDCNAGDNAACGESCNYEWGCTAGTYDCDQCPYDIYGAINYPQY